MKSRKAFLNNRKTESSIGLSFFSFSVKKYDKLKNSCFQIKGNTYKEDKAEKGRRTVVLEEFVVYLLVSLVILFFMSLAFRNRKKVDEGVIFNYFRLSYRRKIIRTIIMVPILALILFIVYLAADWDVIVIVILLSAHFLLSIIQLLYNYYQWKTKEKGTASAEERGFNQ